MNAKQVELSHHWLIKADHDIFAAKQMLSVPDAPTDIPCFHSQQAIEKSLKALLTAYSLRFPKIHDLMKLLDLSLSVLPDLKSYRESFSEISDFAIEVRYPEGLSDPSFEDAQKAFNTAEQVVNLIKKSIRAQTELK